MNATSALLFTESIHRAPRFCDNVTVSEGTWSEQMFKLSCLLLGVYTAVSPQPLNPQWLAQWIPELKLWNPQRFIFFQKNHRRQPVCACNLSLWEADSGGSCFQG